MSSFPLYNKLQDDHTQVPTQHNTKVKHLPPEPARFPDSGVPLLMAQGPWLTQLLALSLPLEHGSVWPLCPQHTPSPPSLTSDLTPTQTLVSASLPPGARSARVRRNHLEGWLPPSSQVMLALRVRRHTSRTTGLAQTSLVAHGGPNDLSGLQLSLIFTTQRVKFFR